MPRIAFRLWLKPDPEGIEVYVWNHLNPFDGLYDAIREAGIEHYTIWLDGADLFLTREGLTPEKGEKMDFSQPVQQVWRDTLTPLFDERVKSEGAGTPDRGLLARSGRPCGPGPDDLPDGLAARRPGRGRGRSTVPRRRRFGTQLRAAGITRQWTWVEDGSAWTYRECADLDATEAALAASPVQAVLVSRLSHYLDERTQREGPRRTREVFRCD